MNKLEKVDELTPYQLDFPKEALPEIFVKDALTTDERMWVPQSDNVWFRPLCLNRSQGYWVTLLKVKKSGVLSRHRHPQGVHGFVIKGRWEYLEHDWVAEEGSYIYEPPCETHTLVVPETIVVHGHEACSICKSNIVECCTGDNCNTDYNLAVGYERS